jgi:hypothetical protein
MRSIRFTLAAFLFATLAANVWADGEPSLPRPTTPEFARGVKFTVNGYTGTEVLTNFPVLVRLKEYNEGTGEGIQGFLYSDFNYTDGTDLCFVDMETNGIPYEIDTWNRSGESLVWVTLPRVTNHTEFVMWYHSVDSGKLVSTGDAWTDYTGVWHMELDSSRNLKDSTANELTAVATSGAKARTSGRIGASCTPTETGTSKDAQCIEVSLSDTDKKNAVNNLNKTETGNAFSVALWVKPERYSTGQSNPQSAYLVGRKVADGDGYWAIQYHYDTASHYNKFRLWTSETSDKNVKVITVDTSVIPDSVSANGNWYKLYVVYNGTTVTLYVNGNAYSASETASTPANGNKNLFLAGTSGTGTRDFRGEMDEVRLRAGVSSEDWVTADYDTVVKANFLLAGKVETVEIVEKPVFVVTLDDSGASHAQFTATVSSLGATTAESCVLKAKIWPTASGEPSGWTEYASGILQDVPTTFKVKGLSTATPYSYKVLVVNNENVEANEIEGTFTTAGVGVAGTGGDITRVGDDWIHYFRVGTDAETGGITNAYVFTPPSYANSVRALVVGGGGPGGYQAGGGGGAGGYYYNAALGVTPSNEYSILVGAGGVAAIAATDYGSNGGVSSILGGGLNVVVAGGGSGGNGAACRAGVAGGSGGGSSFNSESAGSGNSGQGHAGGVGNDQADNLANRLAGGGGGAGAAGGDATATGATHNPGGGGKGAECDITGVSTWYAGGGGGGGGFYNGKQDAAADGGLGGGGKGSRKPASGSVELAGDGVDGLGGGGGGGSGDQAGYYVGGDGGDGIVIIRYPSQGDALAVLEPIVSLKSASYDPEHSEVSFTYRVAWAGAGYNDASVGIAWGFSPSVLSTTNVIKSGEIGIGSGTVELPNNVSKTVYLRAFATNEVGRAALSVEQSVFTLFNPNAPVGSISVTDTGVTNAVFSVNVTDLGTEATSASVRVEVCESEDFTGTVLSFPASTGLSNPGSVSVSATGLAHSTAYYARAVVVNSKEVELTTDTIGFSTLIPGYPNASGMISVHGYTSVSALTRAIERGLGSAETTRWLEVSQSDDFSMLVGTATSITSTAINQDETLTVTDLLPETVYHVRIGISNIWNRISYVPLSDFATRSEPFVASGPTWTSGDGTVDFSLNVGGVYDGATCSATLTYGGSEIGTKNFSEADTVSWNGVAAAADGALAKIVVTATLPNDGGTFTKTYESPVAAGSSGQVVADVSTHFSAANALWMKPGDVVDLPTPTGVASYQVLNERFACLDGDNLIALEPGIVGVRCVDENYVTNVMGVVILPEAIGSGSVYVFDETKHNNSSDWAISDRWKKVGSATNDSYPKNADDIAILPFYNLKDDVYVRHTTDISLGGLYAGQIRPDVSVNCHLEHFKDVDIKTLTFQRTDDNPVDVKTCPNSEGSNYSRIVLAGYDIDVVWASDAVIDGCSSETDVNGPRGRFYVKTGGSTNTLQNVTLTFRGFPGYKIESNAGTDTLKGVWKGTGTIIKEGMGGIAFDGDFSGFEGTIRELSGPNLGGFDKGAAGVLMRAAAASNATAHVYGFVATDANGVPEFKGRGRGYFATGFSSVGSEGGGQAPGKGLYMHGGSYFAKMISGTWGVGTVDEKLLDVLSIGSGMSFLNMDTPNNTGKQEPVNAVTAKTLEQTDKGTFYFYDPSVNNNAVYPTANPVTNNMFTIRDWATHAVGGDGYGEAGIEGATNTFKIIPWFVSAGDSGKSYLMFPAFDSNGRLVRPVRKCTYIDTAGSEDANVTCWLENNIGYGSLTHGTATDIVINSLFLNNSVKGDKWLGADRTLTIKSGGLIFQGNGSAIGLPGRDDNGSLVLGDADHPAYVWNKAFGNYTNQIWAAVTAPGGFVSTYTGNLELGGNQTGIDDEIVVAAGSLALGNAEYGIRLKAGLPVRVCAGAKLVLQKRNAIAKSQIKIDGAGDAFGTVVLAADQICASLAVRDVFESAAWTTLPEGTYGSSDSGAEFVRDDLFTGTGILYVGAEPPPAGVLFLVY